MSPRPRNRARTNVPAARTWSKPAPPFSGGYRRYTWFAAAAVASKPLFPCLALHRPCCSLRAVPSPPFALLFLAHGWLLAGCSSPAPTTPPAAEAVETLDPLPSALPFGVWVDVSNGLPRHFFGEPLRTFPRMRPIPPAPGDLTQGYVLTGPTRWYGKHRAQIRGPYCYFLDGQFYRFQVIADGAVLRPEAIDLFGLGQAQGPGRVRRNLHPPWLRRPTGRGKLALGGHAGSQATSPTQGPKCQIDRW